MNIPKANLAILEALKQVIELPENLVRLTLTMGVDEVPTLDLKFHVKQTDENGKKRHLETVTKRFKLAEEIPVLEDLLDVTVFTDSTRKYVIPETKTQ